MIEFGFEPISAMVGGAIGGFALPIFRENLHKVTLTRLNEYDAEDLVFRASVDYVIGGFGGALLSGVLVGTVIRIFS